MKKSLAVVSILACTLGLCACGSDSTVIDPVCTESVAEQYSEGYADTIIQLVEQGFDGASYLSQVEQSGYDTSDENYQKVSDAIDSWANVADEVGTYTGVISSTVDVDEDEAVVDVTIGGTDHNAVMEFIYSDDPSSSNGGFPEVSTTVKYSFGEMMGKAGLNTLIGMGTVFVVLILISLIISCFKFIPKIQEAFTKKDKASAKDIKAEAVDNTIAQIIEKEEQADDLELVAVIAAAIAASEGAASTDGFVVRSIRKRA